MVKEMKTVDKCTICGMCKTNCPTFSVMKSEVASPRGKAILKKENKLDLIFYECTLCGSCVINCPSNVDLDEEIRSVREKLVKNKKTTRSEEHTSELQSH